MLLPSLVLLTALSFGHASSSQTQAAIIEAAARYQAIASRAEFLYNESLDIMLTTVAEMAVDAGEDNILRDYFKDTQLPPLPFFSVDSLDPPYIKTPPLSPEEAVASRQRVIDTVRNLESGWSAVVDSQVTLRDVDTLVRAAHTCSSAVHEAVIDVHRAIAEITMDNMVLFAMSTAILFQTDGSFDTQSAVTYTEACRSILYAMKCKLVTLREQARKSELLKIDCTHWEATLRAVKDIFAYYSTLEPSDLTTAHDPPVKPSTPGSYEHVFDSQFAGASQPGSHVTKTIDTIEALYYKQSKFKLAYKEYTCSLHDVLVTVVQHTCTRIALAVLNSRRRVVMSAKMSAYKLQLLGKLHAMHNHYVSEIESLTVALTAKEKTIFEAIKASIDADKVVFQACAEYCKAQLGHTDGSSLAMNINSVPLTLQQPEDSTINDSTVSESSAANVQEHLRISEEHAQAVVQTVGALESAQSDAEVLAALFNTIGAFEAYRAAYTSYVEARMGFYIKFYCAQHKALSSKID